MDSTHAPQAEENNVREMPPYTRTELAELLHVSEKTIRRWAKRGLLTFDTDTFPHVVTGAVLLKFLQDHKEITEFAANFSRLASTEKAAIRQKARELFAIGKNQAAICAELASQTHCCKETIRLILTEHDQKHPSNAFVHPRKKKLTNRQQADVYAGIKKGIDVKALAEQYDRSLSTVYAIIKKFDETESSTT